MQTLWGDEEKPQPAKKVVTSRTSSTPVVHTASDCLIYGHNWQTAGMSGEKQCTGCGVKGYCPGCTPNPPQDALPFFCTRHTLQQEGKVEQ